MLIKSQSEVRLHTRRNVHFHPGRNARPSFSIFRGSGSETSLNVRSLTNGCLYTSLGSRLSVSRLSHKLGESLVSLRPLQVILLFLVRGFLCYAGAGGTSATQLTMKTEVIASVFTHATSWKNCSTVLPGSPICIIFHGIKRLCLEQQNTLTITRV